VSFLVGTFQLDSSASFLASRLGHITGLIGNTVPFIKSIEIVLSGEMIASGLPGSIVWTLTDRLDLSNTLAASQFLVTALLDASLAPLISQIAIVSAVQSPTVQFAISSNLKRSHVLKESRSLVSFLVATFLYDLSDSLLLSNYGQFTGLINDSAPFVESEEIALSRGIAASVINCSPAIIFSNGGPASAGRWLSLRHLTFLFPPSDPDAPSDLRQLTAPVENSFRFVMSQQVTLSRSLTASLINWSPAFVLSRPALRGSVSFAFSALPVSKSHLTFAIHRSPFISSSARGGGTRITEWISGGWFRSTGFAMTAPWLSTDDGRARGAETGAGGALTYILVAAGLLMLLALLLFLLMKRRSPDSKESTTTEPNDESVDSMDTVDEDLSLADYRNVLCESDSVNSAFSVSVEEAVVRHQL
jgi:hypothetical protein